MKRSGRPRFAELSRQLLLRMRTRPALLLSAAVLLVLVTATLGHQVEHHIQPVELWVARLGPWGGLVFVGLLVVGTSLLLPEALFGVAAGALFGLAWGTTVLMLGNLLAGAVQYALARRLLCAPIQRTLAARPLLSAIQRAVLQNELRLQLLLRLAPLNPATVSYLLGAVNVRLTGFLFAFLALTPHLFIEVYLGHAGKHLLRLTVGNAQSSWVQDLIVIGGLALCLLAFVIMSRAAYRAVLRAVAETDERASGR